MGKDNFSFIDEIKAVYKYGYERGKKGLTLEDGYLNDHIKDSGMPRGILDGWGFQHYVRHCEQPSKDSYGEMLTVIEKWSNEDMADFIVVDMLGGETLVKGEHE